MYFVCLESFLSFFQVLDVHHHSTIADCVLIPYSLINVIQRDDLLPVFYQQDQNFIFRVGQINRFSVPGHRLTFSINGHILQLEKAGILRRHFGFDSLWIPTQINRPRIRRYNRKVLLQTTKKVIRIQMQQSGLTTS